MDGLVKLIGYVVVLHVLNVQCRESEFPQYISSSRIKLNSDRGYEDVLIGIGEAVPEDPMLIEKIKTVFTEFSSFLFQATNGVFFKEIRILVPDSWNDTVGDVEPSWEMFSTSDIRIDLPDAGPNRHQPATNKPTQCGAPGLYIHLTPKYITDDIEALLFGDRSKTLTHEWGHFRWGVFDEYPLEGDDRFYAASNGEYEATRCVIGIRGEKLNADKQECTFDSSGKPDANCRFFDFRGQSESYFASLMYRQYLPEMETFCDDVDHTGGNPSTTHNIEAPNQQNTLCASKSVWEVLRSHSDFPATTSRKTPTNVLPQVSTVPNFLVVKRQFRASPTVVVLDRSGSMKTNSRLHTLRQACYNLISRIIDEDQLFGIVDFNGVAVIRQYATPAGLNRTHLLNALPTEASGGTAIGSGILEGVAALQNGEPNKDITGSQLVVLTDGEENKNPMIVNLTLGQLHGVTVHTIAIGNQATQNLELIANKTNGKTNTQPDNSAALFNIFSRLAIEDTSRVVPVDIPRNTFNFTTGTVTADFIIDAFLQEDMTVLIAFPEITDSESQQLHVQVIKPNGMIIDENAQDPDRYNFVHDFDLIQIETKAEVGTWQILINMTNESLQLRQGTMHVETRRSTQTISGVLPIVASAQWSVPEMKPDEIQTLYVTVKQGYTPVANAKVAVTVTYPDNTKTRVPVFDDGKGSDVNPKDGVYTGFFSQFKGDGRYSMRVSVQGENGVTNLVQGSRVGMAPAAMDPLLRNAESNLKEVNTGAFSRIIEGESFRCIGSEACGGDRDLYGPYRISDLAVYRMENFTAVLNFTAPGDDLFYGSAEYYEIHASKNATILLRELSNATKLEYVPEDMRTNETEAPFIISGNVSNPQPARSIEIFEIQLPRKAGNFSYVFSVVAVDDEGHRSQPSNLATVSAREVKMEEIPGGSSLPIILGSVLPLLFLLLLLLLLLLFLVRRRKSKVHGCPEAGKTAIAEASPRQNFEMIGSNNIARAAISSDYQRDVDISMNGNVTTYDDLRIAENMIDGKLYTDYDRSAYNFVSTSPESSENISVATTRHQQTPSEVYPFFQIGSKSDELKMADKVYSDASRLPLQFTYGIENYGFQDNEGGIPTGQLSEFGPTPTGPPPRPPKQLKPHDGSAVVSRQVHHYPVIPPKTPVKDDEDSDGSDYEPVANPKSNMQLTMDILQATRRAPPIPKKGDSGDDDEVTSYDEPPIGCIDGRPMVPPKDIEENDTPYDYDEPPPSNGFTGAHDEDSDDSYDYERVDDPNAALGLASS